MKGLGICLGMLFCSNSLEGGYRTQGLGLFDNVRYISSDDGPILILLDRNFFISNCSYDHKDDMNKPLYYVHSLYAQASDVSDELVTLLMVLTPILRPFINLIYLVSSFILKIAESGLLILSNYLRN